MAGNAWTITIVQGDPCSFVADVYYPPDKPVPECLQAEVGDLISWNNQTPEPHQLSTDATPPQELTGRIEKFSSSGGYTPQAVGTINYHCTLHERENGTIEVVA